MWTRRAVARSCTSSSSTALSSMRRTSTKQAPAATGATAPSTTRRARARTTTRSGRTAPGNTGSWCRRVGPRDRRQPLLDARRLHPTALRIHEGRVPGAGPRLRGVVHAVPRAGPRLRTDDQRRSGGARGVRRRSRLARYTAPRRPLNRLVPVEHGRPHGEWTVRRHLRPELESSHPCPCRRDQRGARVEAFG